jgi:hypothetical protein
MTWNTSRAWHAAAAALALTVLASACAPPAEERRPVELDEFAYLVEAHVVSVGVFSCNGEPEITELVEKHTTVSVEVTSTVRNPGDACMDGIAIELDQPLADRKLIDLTSGQTIAVDRAQLDD